MQAEITTIGSIKRRKTDHAVATYFSDLPIGALEHAASFLAPPSRAIFAIALTNPPTESRYTSIAGSDWETLDFGEIEEDMAARLTDDDISGILQHIDAVNNLKRLKLTNCKSITGVGLEPLRGSTIIEQIDLSLYGVSCGPVIRPEPPISCNVVLPILDSIIEIEGCVLKCLEFPYKWRGRWNSSTNSAFHEFILRYNQMRRDRGTIRCLNCNREGVGLDTIHIEGNLYGKHKYACVQCTKDYCYSCRFLDSCDICLRDHCKDCAKVGVKECQSCYEDVCYNCSSFVCDGCENMLCVACITDDRVLECSYCDVERCLRCVDDDTCSICEIYCCGACRLRRLQEGSIDCGGCIKLLSPEALLDQVLQSRRLQQEVKDLKNEIEELKHGIKELNKLC